MVQKHASGEGNNSTLNRTNNNGNRDNTHIYLTVYNKMTSSRGIRILNAHPPGARHIHRRITYINRTIYIGIHNIPPHQV